MNLFEIPGVLPEDELCETLCEGGGMRIERIVSCGQCSQEGFWYDQHEDEWLVLLQGSAVLTYDSGQSVTLRQGDTLFIAAHERHRVAHTSSEPPCIWLCVFGAFENRF